MSIKCPYCKEVEVGLFYPCGHCGKVCEPKDVVRPIETLLPQLSICLVCKTQAFDGHRCHKCQTAILPKARQMFGCVLISEKEERLVTEYFATN